MRARAWSSVTHRPSHTSGRGDYLGSQAYRDALDRMVTVKARVEIFPRTPPVFEPGTKWAYSNIGYELLGRVIEIVSAAASADCRTRRRGRAWLSSWMPYRRRSSETAVGD